MEGALKERFDVNAKDVYGNTDLHEAAKKHNKRLCQLLLRYGAKVNVTVDGGATPLHHAAYFSYNGNHTDNEG